MNTGLIARVWLLDAVFDAGSGPETVFTRAPVELLAKAL